MNRENFLEKARKIHGNRYEYLDIPDEFDPKITTIRVVCPIHGEFLQNARSHYRGSGCKICGLANRKHKEIEYDEFVKRAREIYGNKYDYSKTDLKHRDEKGRVCIICPEHGEFFVKPERHIFKKDPRGCRKCGYENVSKKCKKETEEFISNARSVHGEKYDYSKVEYINNKTKVCIICPEHGEFWQTPNSHLSGNGCKKCSVNKIKESLSGDKEKFVNESKKVHGNKYTYDNFIYLNSHAKGYVTCPIHGDFLVNSINHINRCSGCPKCASPISKWENEICSFLSEIGIEFEQSNRTILDGKEIDIFIRKYNIGIECDGIRWHSEEYRDKNYHLSKTNECLNKGIRLIHIFEDEWKYKSDIWKSMLRNMFGLNEVKIYARKCEIRNVSSSDARKFLNENHIQGFSNGKYAYGLYYNDELVSIMTFGERRINMGGKKIEGFYELVRFCNKLNTNVIGGASKLFKRFINDFNPNEIISYSDKRWSTGQLYDILGFKHDHDSRPNYFYVVGDKRENRFKYRKDRLLKDGFDSDKTEHEIMANRGIYRIYDCGCRAHIWKNINS